jgi:hypothetical protein
MTTINRLPGYLSALTILTLSVALPALADAKPCCRYDRGTANVSSSTCRHNGGRVVDQRYCQRRGWNPGYNQGYNGPNFSITLGNVQFGYTDGYYDQNRGWHNWSNNNERDWYRQNRGGTYHDMQRDRDDDTNRRDWRDGKRRDWRGGEDHR